MRPRAPLAPAPSAAGALTAAGGMLKKRHLMRLTLNTGSLGRLGLIRCTVVSTRRLDGVFLTRVQIPETGGRQQTIASYESVGGRWFGGRPLRAGPGAAILYLHLHPPDCNIVPPPLAPPVFYIALAAPRARPASFCLRVGTHKSSLETFFETSLETQNDSKSSLKQIKEGFAQYFVCLHTHPSHPVLKLVVSPASVCATSARPPPPARTERYPARGLVLDFNSVAAPFLSHYTSFGFSNKETFVFQGRPEDAISRKSIEGHPGLFYNAIALQWIGCGGSDRGAGRSGAKTGRGRDSTTPYASSKPTKDYKPYELADR
ncbi:hypothetical protein EVAR_36616_1 [Eumeta japonica]|uniref:Uncharacterized protein n=1 Tax=Eumeta variegata TaxID=151549 RepID=A0A4C1ZJI3_EUMVA|nr:hypothetical protein EVAR_36616_1 [Eumeta japonica]